MTDVEYDQLKRRIQSLLHLDLNAYKQEQMRRRLEAFVSQSGFSPTSFTAQLNSDRTLLGKLADVITINVTEFFRDRAQFDHLRDAILPDLLKTRGRLRIWSAACSFGQEPYSVAMLLADAGAAHRATIVATDIDDAALATAANGGPYTAAQLHGVTADGLARHFEPDGERYRIGTALRRRVEFRKLNLLSDPFAAAFDLVICRNVMIYFSEDTKATLLQRFHAALTPAGVLFVGGSEALLNAPALGFERAGPNFYRKSAVQERSDIAA